MCATKVEPARSSTGGLTARASTATPAPKHAIRHVGTGRPRRASVRARTPYGIAYATSSAAASMPMTMTGASAAGRAHDARSNTTGRP